MKIVAINDDFPEEGGSSVACVVRDLRSAWQQLGHDVTVITRHDPRENAGTIERAGVISLPIAAPLPLLRHYHCVFNPRPGQTIARVLEHVRPDAVSVHNVHASLTYGVLGAARHHTARLSLTMHDVFGIGFGRLNTSRFLSSQGQDARLTMQDHWQAAGPAYNPLRNAFIRHTIRQTGTAVVAVSQSLQRALAQNGLKGAAVIHHGLPVRPEPNPATVEAFRQRLGLTGRRVILFGGRISRDKGAHCIAAAMRIVRQQVPNATLLVVGDERRWRAAGGSSEDTVLAGWLSPEDMRLAYALADIVTTPSLCLDTFNLMNLEGMAASKPVVGTIFGGTPEVVEHGVTGFVCDPRDLSTYSAHLTTILLDEKLQHRLGEQGRARAQAQFPLVEKAKQYLSLFNGSSTVAAS